MSEFPLLGEPSSSIAHKRQLDKIASVIRLVTEQLAVSTAKRIELTCVLVTLASLALFIVACSTPAIISTSGFGSLKTDKLSGDFGPFRACYTIGDEHDCETVNNDCEFPVTILGTADASITTNVPIVDDCKKWNAARGFLVLAALLSGGAFLAQLIFACSETTSGVAQWMSIGLGLLASIAGVISMSLYIYLRDHDDTFQSANKADFAYGFICLTIGWILIFFASMPFAAKKY